MHSLIVEDDFVSRRLLQALLTPHGTVDVAVNGVEAVEAFRLAHDEGRPYDLVCLDIMMPQMDGREVLGRVRALEASRGIGGLQGCKIIMTTALDDYRTIMDSFRDQCEAYLVKPISRDTLDAELRRLGLAA